MKLPAIIHALLLATTLSTLGCAGSDKEAAIKEIQAAGGTFSYDDQGRIITVDLSDTNATDEELAAISVLPEVRTINCSNAHRITGKSLGLLAKLKNLETLYLVDTALDDDGMSRLRGLTSLKTLNLDGTPITDAGMPAIDNLVNLQTLVLGNTKITDKSLVQLRDLRELSTLILRNTKTTPQGVKELHRMLPDVRVVD
jgi:Leucine-rich repeat (LRR) protein